MPLDAIPVRPRIPDDPGPEQEIPIPPCTDVRGHRWVEQADWQGGEAGVHTWTYIACCRCGDIAPEDLPAHQVAETLPRYFAGRML